MATVALTLGEPLEAATELLLGLPFDTPEQRFLGFEVDGAEALGVQRAQVGGQTAVRLLAQAGVSPMVRLRFEEGASEFPAWIFDMPRGRHETPSADLVALIAELAPEALDPEERVEAIVRHVESRFDYGMREVGLGDDTQEMPALSCDIELGTCVDTHSYAVAAMRAAGLDAAYITGVFFPEGAAEARPGHCWFVVRADGAPHHWDISHHLKYGLGPVRPVFNPRPGTRFALGAGRDLVFDGPAGPVAFGRLSGFHRLDGSGEKLATRAQLGV